jgi:hypothetical protein
MQRSLIIVPALALTFATTLAGAQPAPSKPHPRIWLDAQTRAGLEAQSTVAGGAVARGATRCSAARENPSSYSNGGWQGFEFVTTLSGCLLSWISSRNADDLATAIKYWNVLLDDYQSVGDGAGGDSVVTHDTGYAMRTFAPYSALAYDWLHDAPGVSEELRARSRSRFDAWMNYYTTSGYLRHMPGANYQAGYLFAATLIAIAEAGEAGAAGDAHWATVRDEIWGTDMAAALEPGGVLDGGDWPEGWQYAPLSVLEYSLAARALGENGLSVAGAERWASSLVPRFAHGLTPATRQMYPAGDSETETANRDPANGALLAAIAGPADDRARTWARWLAADLGLENENPLFDALAAARDGASEPFATTGATSYLAPGVGNLYTRGSWTSDAAWSVFQCSRRLVDDHQHNNAGNFVLSRGADDIVIDPSPYGSLSTLTGNAPAVDSAAVPSGYSPSQGNWGETTALAWARTASTGVAAARCDYADQFRRSDVPSDVSQAVRDFAFVPGSGSGTVVLVDRVVTGSATRGLHLRVRTPTTLALSGSIASGTVGASLFAIEKVWSTNGAPTVRSMPKASECSSSNRTCDVSRLTGMEYRIDVSGPAGLALHVVDVTTSGQPASSRSMLAGNGYRGVLVEREANVVAVVTNDAPDAALGGSLVYRVPARAGALHVVFDAPVNAQGKSDVLARLDGSDCEVTVTPSASAVGYDGRPLFVRTTAACTPTEDAGQPSEPGSGGSGGSSGGGTSGTGGGYAGGPGGEAGAGSLPGTGAGASSGTSGATGSDGSGGASGTAGLPGTGGPDARTQGCTFTSRRSDASSFSVVAGVLFALLVRFRRRRSAR